MMVGNQHYVGLRKLVVASQLAPWVNMNYEVFILHHQGSMTDEGYSKRLAVGSGERVGALGKRAGESRNQQKGKFYFSHGIRC